MKIEWQTAQAKRQFWPEHENEAHYGKDDAGYDEQSTKLVHSLIIRGMRRFRGYRISSWLKK